MYNAVLQPPYVVVEEEEEGGGWGVGGGWRVPPCANSALTQIVPISASIYTVFHSVIFNSVHDTDLHVPIIEYCVQENVSFNNLVFSEKRGQLYFKNLLFPVNFG